MKQRITIEQIAELSEGQKQRLRELTESKVQDGDYVAHNGMKTLVDDAEELKALMNCYKNKFKECYILFSIGQMIELLQSKDRRNMIPKIRSSYYDGEIYCDVTLYAKDRVIDTDNFPECRPCPELADALWQAVKEVL